MNGQSSFICNGKKTEINQLSIIWQIDKLWYIHPMKRSLAKKECILYYSI